MAGVIWASMHYNILARTNCGLLGQNCRIIENGDKIRCLELECLHFNVINSLVLTTTALVRNYEF